ncbi:MAG: carboxyltransferase domain-containing protein, partial [Pseudomonadota bacterium]
MRARLTAVQIAEDVFEIAVDTPADAQRLALELRKIGLAEDVVAGINRVAVSFDPARHDQVMAWMDDLPQTVPTNEAPPPAVDIPIQYGGEFGPDLANVCAALGMTQAAFVDLHSSCTHAVDMIGFTPGFTYISGLPDSVSVPRLDMPRPRLIAGSVGISGAL